MTDREKQLIVGVLTKVYTGTLDSSKSLEEQCEDFVSLGAKVLDATDDAKAKEEYRLQQIKQCEQEIKNIQHEMYIRRIEDLILSQCSNL